MYQVFLGLGSNVGERLQYLDSAVADVSAIARVLALSSVYETSPVGMESQNDFYNMAIEIETPMHPPELLKALKKIERKLGRRSSVRMHDREIDIDILMYRGLEYEDSTVKVPHPQLEHRRFALEPLAEIAPTAVHPVLEKTIATLLRQCHDVGRVERTAHQLTQPQT
jgi:2-amino-4-hydroxy-6-hydroxymethyldihydropteridine diphosphokinase